MVLTLSVESFFVDQLGKAKIILKNKKCKLVRKKIKKCKTGLGTKSAEKL